MIRSLTDRRADHDPSSHADAPRSRRWIPVVGVLAAVGVDAWGWQQLLRSRVLDACAAEGERIETSWNEPRANEIATAFDALAITYTADAWTRARGGFDAYAAQWTSTRTEVCEAADLEHTLPPDLALAARACLDEQLEWRQLRGKSQLALALEAGVSARHVSFVESGRANPSRERIATLAAALGIPLRERNTRRAGATARRSTRARSRARPRALGGHDGPRAHAGPAVTHQASTRSRGSCLDPTRQFLRRGVAAADVSASQACAG